MKEKYIEDLADIKDIMNRSSKFITLSGLSGISTGVIAIIGGYMAYQVVFINQEYQSYERFILSSDSLVQLLLIASGTIILAISSVIYFTLQTAKKMDNATWDIQTKPLLINLFIPIITGGILCILLLQQGYIGLIAPLTMIFYGLGLVNASKFTLQEMRSLGIIEILLGLLAIYFISYGLLAWVIGFGFIHIVYGVIVHLKYTS